MTIAEEIETLKRLSQGGAAWLVGTSARSLRASDCPRNADGSYDARRVLNWCQKRIGATEIVEAVGSLGLAPPKDIRPVVDAVLDRSRALIGSSKP